MSDTLSVVAVSGSEHSPSKTAALLEAITAEVGRRLTIDAQIIELNDLDLTWDPKGDEVRGALTAVASADLLIVASPVYRASYTGRFKQFFDLLGREAIVAKPVLLAASGGDLQHSLVIDTALRPLFGFFNALSLPHGVYATDADFADGAVTSPRLLAAIALAVETAIPVIRADRHLVSAVAGRERVAAGARLLDVRSDAGRDAAGAVDGAEVVLKTAVEAWTAGLDRDTPIVVFCGSVRGSGPVAAQLVDAGFTDVVHVDGGFAALQAAGAPTRPAS